MGTTELAQTLFGGSGDTVPLPQSTSTVYATAVADSENGSVKVVMDGQSITQPSGEETTVTLNADDFSDGVAELPLPAYAGTVSVIDSDGTYLLEDEFQVNGRFLTINALSGAKAVEVDYPANITLALRNTDFSPADDSAQLPIKPKGAVTLKLDGETVPNTVDGTTIKAEGVAAKQDASFTITYTRSVSATTTFEDGIYQLAESPSTITLTGITLSEDADPVETSITGYELDDNIVTLTDTTHYDQYVVGYTMTDTVTLNYSDTIPESTLEDTEEETEEAEQEAAENAGKVELNYQPTTVTVTCDGESYTDFTLETNVVSLNWRPDPVLVYTVEYESDVSLDLSTDDFANGQYKLPYIPTGTVATKVDGETVPNTVSEYMLEIPSLIVEIPSYTVTYQSEVANGEVEIPTSPSVRAGEAVQVSVINGTPVATAVIGEGDIQNANIQIAEDNSELAKTLASEADAIAKATNQHFWDDNDGAHVTEVTQEEWKAATEKKGANSLWNSLGMLFRKGITNLMALVVDDPDDEVIGTTGVAIFDGQGNNPENIVASFTDSGVTLGREDGSNSTIDDNGMTINFLSNVLASFKKILTGMYNVTEFYSTQLVLNSISTDSTSGSIVNDLIIDSGGRTSFGSLNPASITAGYALEINVGDDIQAVYIAPRSATACDIDVQGNVTLRGTLNTSDSITASGSITTTGGASIVKDSRLDRDGTAPSSTQWSRVFGVTDKDGELVGYIQAAQYNDGRIQFQILACNEKSDGTQVNNSFGLIVAKDGTTSYTITNPEALRTALGKYTRSSVGALDWGTNNDYLVAKSALAYWNGAYSGTTSNLAYCNKGAFGSFATKNSLAAADVPSLDAGIITSGTFDVARIPNLAASKITSGTVARARIENTAWAYLVGSASTVASGNYVRWRMVAGIVFLQVCYRSGAGLTAGSAKSLGTIPANYRPSSVVESTGYLGAGNASPCDIWVETNGNAYIVTATAASSKFYGTLSYPLG